MYHLRELRTQKGLTQAELSKTLQVSASSIGMYEQGRREPDNETLGRIANYFNVSTDYLLGRTDEPQGTGLQKGDGGGESQKNLETSEPESIGGSTILMRAQSELDEDELKQLENMAEFFLKQKLNN